MANKIIEEHGEMVVATRNPLLNPSQVLSMSCLGLAGEAGEVIELVKKHLYHGRSLDANQLELEIGDILWYLHSLCEATGISIERAFERNTDKILDRHPKGFDTGYMDNG